MYWFPLNDLTGNFPVRSEYTVPSAVSASAAQQYISHAAFACSDGFISSSLVMMVGLVRVDLVFFADGACVLLGSRLIVEGVLRQHLLLTLGNLTIDHC